MPSALGSLWAEAGKCIGKRTRSLLPSGSWAQPRQVKAVSPEEPPPRGVRKEGALGKERQGCPWPV